MIYVFLAIVAVTIDNMCMGYLVTRIDIFSMLCIWCFCAALVGLCSSAVVGVKKSEIAAYAQYPIKSAMYFLLSLFGILFWVKSIITLGVGSSVILSKLGVLIPILWGVFIFKERLNIIEWLLGGILLIGVLIFSWKGGVEMQTGMLYIVASTICYSFQKVLSKDLSKKVSLHFTIFLRSLIIALSMVVIFMLSNYSFQIPSLKVFLIAALGGIVGGFLNKYFMFKAYQLEDLAKVMLFYSAKPIVVFISAALFLQESVTWLKVIGGLIIIISVMLLGYQHMKQKS